MMLKIINNR